MYIKNVKVFTEDGIFQQGNVLVEGDRIKEVILCNDTPEVETEIIDGQGAYLIPGMLDVHFHGSMGADFCDGTLEAINTIGAYQASVGVTGMIPATLTLSTDELCNILSHAKSYENTPQKADLLGVNMEGPFISPAKKGAQNEAFIADVSTDTFRKFQEASGGLVKYIAVAPEKPGAVEFVLANKASSNVSVAHTNATYEQAMEVYDAGANHAVHLFNAMPVYTHREPGVIGAVFDSAHVTAEIICDGVHIHPAVIRNTLNTIGDDRLIFISDSMRATGMPDGIYDLGGLDVQVKGNRATLVEGGAIAGSATNLLDCVRTAVKEMKIPLESAIKCATMNPAKSAGVYDNYGSIRPGKKANMVLLGKELELITVIKDGSVLK